MRTLGPCFEAKYDIMIGSSWSLYSRFSQRVGTDFGTELKNRGLLAFRAISSEMYSSPVQQGYEPELLYVDHRHIDS